MTRKHRSLDLTGLKLDYALAMALDWTEPMYGVGKIRYHEDDNYMTMDEPDPDEDEFTEPHHFNHYVQWAPQRFKSIILQLMIEHQVSVNWECGSARVSKSGFAHTGENLGTAVAQLLVACKFGLHVELPEHIN